MGVLIESYSEYLHEGMMKSIPLCEADENKDKKSFFQKIKDFFRKIWQWIKDKVMTLFRMKKKSAEDKLATLKELLKDSKRPSSPNFEKWCERVKDGFFSKSIEQTIKYLSNDDDSSRAKIENEIEKAEQILDMAPGDAIGDSEDRIILRNLNDVKMYEEIIKNIDDEIKELEKTIKKLADNVDKTIPEANMNLLKRYSNIIPKSISRMSSVIKEWILVDSIKVAKANKE
jgi:hypothetical protein